MEEVEGFLSGERNYTKIEGCTGPLGNLMVHVHVVIINYL